AAAIEEFAVRLSREYRMSPERSRMAGESHTESHDLWRGARGRRRDALQVRRATGGLGRGRAEWPWRPKIRLRARTRRTRARARQGSERNHRNCRRGHPKGVSRHTENRWSLSPVRFALRTLRLRWREREQNSTSSRTRKREFASMSLI